MVAALVRQSCRLIRNSAGCPVRADDASAIADAEQRVPSDADLSQRVFMCLGGRGTLGWCVRSRFLMSCVNVAAGSWLWVLSHAR